MALFDRLKQPSAPAQPPEAIDVTPDNAFHFTWAGKVHAVTSVDLRDACPCAACVEEFTGKKILERGKIPPDVHPTQIAPVGNYAIQITWSDGHDSGIYTWETLRRVCGA